MACVVSATEARIRFGELMRRAVETHEPITVERAGKPWVVILSVESYRRLEEARARSDWQDILDRIRALRARIRKPAVPPEEVVRKMREERDARLAGLP